jgi:hypothetical protein
MESKLARPIRSPRHRHRQHDRAERIFPSDHCDADSWSLRPRKMGGSSSLGFHFNGLQQVNQEFASSRRP